MKINEIFYSLQGEGHFAGTPAVFVRFSGCNLACGFCDTDHRRGEEWGEEAVVAEVLRHPARHVVLTGGEPALQATASLVDKLHRAGCYVQMETNGTCAAAAEVGVDWITSGADRRAESSLPGAGLGFLQPVAPGQGLLPAALRHERRGAQCGNHTRNHRIHKVSSPLEALPADPQAAGLPLMRRGRRAAALIRCLGGGVPASGRSAGSRREIRIR